ncbi:MAG: hypothetical protein DME22_10400 [Verrucomicrobia bacterium]|nr:MAG: hypothetical protein DME22_10400 [Verrucomicrobiota bacterium]PYJ95779.1 MAG: hypothetical protein DME23_22790 [Verrucomicrobiota bacterium]
MSWLAVYGRPLCLIGRRHRLASLELIRWSGGKNLFTAPCFSQLPFVNTDLLPMRKGLIPLIRITLPQNVNKP